RHWHAITHIATQFLLDITRELDRSSFGKENAVVQPQPAQLPFIVGTIIGILAGFIHEPVPHVDILNAGALGAGTVELVEIRRLAGRASTAKWWQTDPDDRHTLALESSNRVVDAPRVDLFPFLAAKLGRANRFFRALS